MEIKTFVICSPDCVPNICPCAYLCVCLSLCTPSCPPPRSLSHPLACETNNTPCLCSYFRSWRPAGLGVCLSMFGGGVIGLRRLALSLSLSMSIACSTFLAGQRGWAKSEHRHTQTYFVGGGGLQLFSDTQTSRTLRQNLDVPFCFHTSRILLATLTRLLGFHLSFSWITLVIVWLLDNLCGY